MVEKNQLVVADHVMDMIMIQRNIRDLAKTASFAHSDELEELYQLALSNLKAKMQPGQPLAEAPDLVAENFKMLSMVRLQTVEVKRKAADTLIKARVLVEPVSPAPAVGNLEADPLEGDPSEGATFHEAGVFGDIVASNSSESPRADYSEPDVAV